jgi:hypothetical protein
VNKALPERRNTDAIVVVSQRVAAAEIDDMGSYVGTKKEARWPWHAIDHHNGTVLAYVFGRHKDEGGRSSSSC